MDNQQLEGCEMTAHNTEYWRNFAAALIGAVIGILGMSIYQVLTMPVPAKAAVATKLAPRDELEAAKRRFLQAKEAYKDTQMRVTGKVEDPCAAPPASK